MILSHVQKEEKKKKKKKNQPHVKSKNYSFLSRNFYGFYFILFYSIL